MHILLIPSTLLCGILLFPAVHFLVKEGGWGNLISAIVTLVTLLSNLLLYALLIHQPR